MSQPGTAPDIPQATTNNKWKQHRLKECPGQEIQGKDDVCDDV